MIVVTGGAGFIGSALVWRLNQRGDEHIIIVDNLGTSEKWKNLIPLRYSDYLDKNSFIDNLEKGFYDGKLSAIIHMGACSSTTERNADYLMENNYRYTKRLAQWQNQHQEVRFIYASSAATYGGGGQGYNDNEKELYKLRPLNMYGYSKQMFDLLAKRKGWLKNIVGLKFFNVFGPNENHKADMRSLVNKAFPGLRDQGKMKLFKSYRSDYKDGEQRRDFIYVKDAVEMTLFFLDREDVNGIYNIGTGIAHTWNEIAHAMFAAVNKECRIEYFPMPEILRDKYQYYTCADLKKLRSRGCNHTCMSIDEAIKDYINNYLITDKYLDFHE